MFVLACAAMAATAIVIRVSFGEGPVQPWCAKLFLGTLTRFVNKNCDESTDGNRISSAKHDIDNGNESPHERHKLLAISNQDRSNQSSTDTFRSNSINPTFSDGYTEPIDDSLRVDEKVVNDRHLRMLLKRATSVLDFFIMVQNDVDTDSEERDIRLDICFVAERLLFYWFSFIVLVVTTWAIAHMTIGSIVDFNWLKNGI